MAYKRVIPKDRAVVRSKSTQHRLIVDPTALKTFLDNVEQGITLKNCARLAGLDPCTVTNWIKRGEEIEQNGDYSPGGVASQYVHFYKQFELAKAKFEQMHAVNINANALGFTDTKPEISQRALKSYLPNRYEDKFRIQQEANKLVNSLFKYLLDVMPEESGNDLIIAMAGVKGFQLERDSSKVEMYQPVEIDL